MAISEQAWQERGSIAAALAPRADFAHFRGMGVDTSGSGERSEASEAGAHRLTGALTITRAGSTQREIDLLPDPVTLDIGGVEKIDTVGAWLIHRAVRDRGARVVGASP